MQAGIIFDIKKYAIHDGPGLRTTVFLKGCPLVCGWCHNPEGMTPTPERGYRRQRCIGCGECAAACDGGALKLTATGVLPDESRCVKCLACAQACPSEAMAFIGKAMTVGEVLAEVEKDIIFYDESGGGVTFSGGEPLMQPDFLRALLGACGDLALHRAVDTSGYVPGDTLLSIARRTDLFLFDLKHMDPEKHRRLTGVSNQQILENLALLAGNGAEMIVRIPILPGVNDDSENLAQTGEFLSGLSGMNGVSILPFHDSARGKYSRLNTAASSPDIDRPGKKRMRDIADRLAQWGLRVSIGG